tara:strand:+ start:876 stop:1256 length:381 start_codon:yes stop_codon:yes gene_type:complete
MAVKNLKPGAGFASRGNLRSKGVDMTPVKIGDLNNQVIPQVNADIRSAERTAANALAVANENKVTIAPLAGIARGIFADCGAAKTGGVLVGELYVLRQSYVVNILGENQNLQTDTIVLMGEECPEP